MKKKLLFLGALALSSLSAFAQWTLPEVKGSDFVPGYTWYLYNKEAGAWIRFNPLDGNGVVNDNVTDLRFSMVESDNLEIEKQKNEK